MLGTAVLGTLMLWRSGLEVRVLPGIGLGSMTS